MKVRYLIFLVILANCTAILGKPDQSKRAYYAKSPNPHPPAIDGQIDDAAWSQVEWQGEFTQWEPDDGAAPSEKTKFKILVDQENFYLAIRALDSEPDKIEKRVTRRDLFEGDWVEVNIDSYHDLRTARSFTLNAAGVQGDEAVSEDGDNWDSNWDAVWYGEVSHDDKGWSAEIRIPLSQLRFSPEEEPVWGLQVKRYIFRKGERSIWQYIPKDSGGWVSYFGELRGLPNLKSSRRIELMPYAVSNSRFSPKESGNPFATGRDQIFSGGLDAKLGLTNNLTMDITINPDFGQVEADPSEVNLTAFESFFQEKRPFFMEGRSIFESRLMFGDGGASSDRLFYSRRIGRSPQHSPEVDAGEFSTQPQNTSISTAVKLTGKTESGWSIGIMDAITQKETAQIDFNGARSEEAVEPFTNYFVGRLQKDYNKGNSQLGGIFTAVNRNLEEANLNWMKEKAYSGGFDFTHRWDDKTYSFTAKTAFSNVRGSKEAITNIQESSQRYYQRPDARHVKLDTSLTALSGHGGLLNISRNGKGNWRSSVGMIWRSPGLELNDMGFLQQADRIMQWTWAGYRINNPFFIFRRLNLNFNQWAGWNFDRQPLFTGGNINGGGQFNNYWGFHTGIGRETDILSTSELRGGPGLKGTGWWNQWITIYSDNRKPVEVRLDANNNWADDGGSMRNTMRFNVSFRPLNSMRISLRPSYTFNRNNAQYLDKIEIENSSDRFIFGELRQKTFAVTVRFDYSITPNLSIQYYGQPFVSSGSYSEYKSIVAPKANNYSDRYYQFSEEEATLIETEDGQQLKLTSDSIGAINTELSNPNFSFRQFRSNLVVRWQYRPGSTAFLIWTQERTGDDSDGHFSFSQGIDNLFDEDPVNVFLVKFSRWFSM